MPYLQPDVSKHYATDVKRDLAKRMGELYARSMPATRCIAPGADGPPTKQAEARARDRGS
jgi:hypothetical protein